MKTLTLIISILIVLLAGIISFIAVNMLEPEITGASTSKQYTYTTAICDNSKCQDYEITCSGNTLIGQIPISGAIVYHDSNWEDPRNENTINTFCEMN